MITGDIKNQIDRIRRLDDLHTLIAGKTLTANQIEFVNLVVDHLSMASWSRRGCTTRRSPI